MITKRHSPIWLYSLLLLFFSIQALASVEVGQVEFARGTVAAEQVGQAVRMLGKGETIFQGDNIQTSDRSFAILAFNDGAKITVRPNTSFSIDTYLSETEAPKADLSLHKGGVRASSGKIAEKNPDNFKIHTAKAVVKAAKADYTVRLCGADCAEESKKLKPVAISTNQTVVARAVEIKGNVLARTIKGDDDPRLLKVGAPVYRTDRIEAETGSSALIVFRDGGRITVQPGSVFEIKDYRYQAKDKPDAAKLALVKGGLRALTGLIGKENKDAYAVETPVATMGIRGTGFDLMFIIQGDASSGYKVIGVPRNTNPGLYASVWDGSIVQANNAGQFVLAKGQASFIANIDGKPKIIAKIPVFFRENPSPRPDDKDVDMEILFGSEPVDGSDPGVYVTVEDGHVEVENESGTAIDLGKTEAAFVDEDGKIVRMDVILNFQVDDPYPSPSDFTDETGEVVFSLLADDFGGSLTADNIYMCRCD